LDRCCNWQPRRPFKLKHKPTLFIYLVFACTILSADEVNNTKTLTTNNSILEDFCCDEHTCGQDGPELLFHNDGINSITSLNISTDYQTRDNFNIDYPDLPESVTMSRDGETIYQFTNCGQTGRYGPSQPQANSSYSGTNLDGSVTVSGGIQYWTVPSTGIYTIEAWGAQSGRSDEGYGARMKGDFDLTAGIVLKILVGQKGGLDTRTGGSHPLSVSGGGGTFVAENDNTPLIVAGAGGARRNNNNSTRRDITDGTTNIDGQDGYKNGSLNNGGTNGGGGTTSYTGNHGGGGGAGFTGNGDASNDSRGGSPIDPMSFINGGVGGYTPSNHMSEPPKYGGFGGGSAGGWGGSGGGGGYSGGGSDYNNGYSGGGGSYNAGVNQDNQGGIRSGHGQVIITSAAPSNTAPTATAQSVTGNEDSPQTITLAGSDAEGDALTYALATNPSNGTWTLSGNVVTYTPNTNYNGSDSFTFTVSDGELTSSAATVNISITAVNDAPAASAQSVSGNEDSPQTITLAGTDADGDNLTYALATNPSNGTWTLSGNVVTYTPNANYNGSDGFTFTVSDGEATSSPATVSITVTAVNDVPVIASTPALDALDGSLYEYSISVNDIDGDDVAITATTKPDWLTISNNNSNSLSFDGTASYVNMGTNASLNITSSLTIELWMKPNQNLGNGEWDRLVHRQWQNGYYFGGQNGRVNALAACLSGDCNSFTTPNNTVVVGAWQHVAFVFDDVANTVTIYKDGVVVMSTTYTGTITGNPNATFTISEVNHEAFDGSIDDVRIWNIARSQSDIQNYMNAELNGSESGLAGYWKLDEGSGTTVNDLTSNDNDGTINGASWSTDVSSSSYVLSGIPGSSDGGLHDIILSANDNNGGVVTQSYTVAVSLHSLEITGESGFRILSSPVSGTIYSDLLEELWTQGAEGSDNANSNPNIWTYGNGWNPVTDFSSDALTAGQGFLMYVFADTDFDGEDDLPVTISIDGAQQQSATSVVSEPSDWNLIGNPYGLSVDISQMLSDNNTRFNSTVYSLDRINPGYRTHNGTVGNIQGDEIKPFDGFWIQADTDGDVFEFTEQSIRRGSINSNGRTTTDESSGSAVFTFTNGGYSSSTYLSFTPEGHINLDPADANRLVPLSPAEHLTSMIYESSKSLAINNLPFDLSTDISMDMDVMMLSPTDDGYATEAEQVDLTWDITNLPEGITLVLRNNITGQNINLTGYPSAIISLPSKGSFLTSGDFMATYPVVGQSQFTLSVYGTLAATEDDILPERLTLHSAYPNPFNPSTIISFDLLDADMVSLDIFDIAGRQVASLINEYMIPGSHQINWNPGSLSSGIYLVNLVVGTETLNQKITYIK